MKRFFSMFLAITFVVTIANTAAAYATQDEEAGISRGEFMNMLYEAHVENGGKTAYKEWPPVEAEFVDEESGTVWWDSVLDTGFGGVLYFEDVEFGLDCYVSTGWGLKSGIVNGISKHMFAPDEAITREQVAVILYRYSEWKGIELPVVRESDSFSDADVISVWAAEAVYAIFQAEIMDGKSNNCFDPKGMVTRAEAATVLSKMFSMSISIADEDTDYVPNPYERYSESSDYWRYDLFEIFRGTETVIFDDTLDYEKDYSQVITYEEQDNVLHEFKCKISLPQATQNEPWTENINAYYQGLLPELIAEGADTWDVYYDDWGIHELSYYYENAYKHENIITIVRSCNFYGWRPGISWEPFSELFSAIDGQKLCLDDLFCVGRDEYRSVLQFLLSEATIYGEDYKPSFQSRVGERLDDASVAVTEVGLVFIYPTGAVSDTASGVVFLNVSYEDLHGLLNPIYFPDRVD